MGFNQSNQLDRIDRNIVRLLQRDARKHTLNWLAEWA